MVAVLGREDHDSEFSLVGDKSSRHAIMGIAHDIKRQAIFSVGKFWGQVDMGVCTVVP
jgi:hypothetical protein